MGMNTAKRTLLILLAGVSFMLVGCGEVGITGRRQLNFMPDSVINKLSIQQYSQFISENKVSGDVQKSEMVQRCGSRIQKAVEDFEGAAEAETLSRTVVQVADVGSQLCLGDLGQIRAFGQILAQQAVGVLVGASLPGVIGMGEVDGHGQLAFEFGRTRELPTVVQREAVPFISGPLAETPLKLSGDWRGGTSLDLSRDPVAAGAIHTGHEESLAALADDGIAFPIAQPPPFVGLSGSVLDGSFSQDLALT